MPLIISIVVACLLAAGYYFYFWKGKNSTRPANGKVHVVDPNSEGQVEFAPGPCSAPDLEADVVGTSAVTGIGIGAAGAITLAQEFPLIGRAFAVLNKLYTVYREVGERNEICGRVLNWSSSILKILESIAGHYSEHRETSYTGEQQSLIRSVVEDLEVFCGESEKQLKKSTIVSFITSKETGRRLNILQQHVDTSLRNLMIGMQAEAVKQNGAILKNSAVTLDMVGDVHENVQEMMAQSKAQNDEVKVRLESMEKRKDAVELRDSRNKEMEIDDRSIKWIEKAPFAHGSFGDVFRVKYEGNIIVAKKICLRDVPDKALDATKKEYRKEVALMAELRSQSIVQILGALTRPTELIILMEYCEGGTLRQKLNNLDDGSDAGTWGGTEQASMLLDICFGMKYLHDKKVIHQDLKSLNILIDERGRGKVADFGNSKSNNLNSQNSARGESGVGTYAWCAPEVIKGEKASLKSDLYSFGIIVWEILTKQIPWEGMEVMQIVFATASENRRPELTQEQEETANETLKNIMRDSWQVDAMKRPHFDDLVEILDELHENLLGQHNENNIGNK